MSVKDASRRTDNIGENTRKISEVADLNKDFPGEDLPNGQSVSFMYAGEERNVVPERIDAAKKGGVYFVGYDKDRQAVRSFRVDRMESIASSDREGLSSGAEEAEEKRRAFNNALDKLDEIAQNPPKTHDGGIGAESVRAYNTSRSGDPQYDVEVYVQDDNDSYLSPQDYELVGETVRFGDGRRGVIVEHLADENLGEGGVAPTRVNVLVTHDKDGNRIDFDKTTPEEFDKLYIREQPISKDKNVTKDYVYGLVDGDSRTWQFEDNDEKIDLDDVEALYDFSENAIEEKRRSDREGLSSGAERRTTAAIDPADLQTPEAIEFRDAIDSLINDDSELVLSEGGRLPFRPAEKRENFLKNLANAVTADSDELVGRLSIEEAFERFVQEQIDDGVFTNAEEALDDFVFSVNYDLGISAEGGSRLDSNEILELARRQASSYEMSPEEYIQKISRAFSNGKHISYYEEFGELDEEIQNTLRDILINQSFNGKDISNSRTTKLMNEKLLDNYPTLFTTANLRKLGLIGDDFEFEGLVEEDDDGGFRPYMDGDEEAIDDVISKFWREAGRTGPDHISRIPVQEFFTDFNDEHTSLSSGGEARDYGSPSDELNVNIFNDRMSGMSLDEAAEKYGMDRTEIRQRELRAKSRIDTEPEEEPLSQEDMEKMLNDSILQDRISGMTLQEASEKWGVSREEIRQREIRSMRNAPGFYQNRYRDENAKDILYGESGLSSGAGEPNRQGRFFIREDEPDVVSIDGKPKIAVMIRSTENESGVLADLAKNITKTLQVGKDVKRGVKPEWADSPSNRENYKPGDPWFIDASMLKELFIDENGDPISLNELSSILGTKGSQAETLGTGKFSAISESTFNDILKKLNIDQPSINAILAKNWGFDGAPSWGWYSPGPDGGDEMILSRAGFEKGIKERLFDFLNPMYFEPDSPENTPISKATEARVETENSLEGAKFDAVDYNSLLNAIGYKSDDELSIRDRAESVSQYLMDNFGIDFGAETLRQSERNKFFKLPLLLHLFRNNHISNPSQSLGAVGEFLETNMYRPAALTAVRNFISSKNVPERKIDPTLKKAFDIPPTNNIDSSISGYSKNDLESVSKRRIDSKKDFLSPKERGQIVSRLNAAFSALGVEEVSVGDVFPTDSNGRLTDPFPTSLSSGAEDVAERAMATGGTLAERRVVARNDFRNRRKSPISRVSFEKEDGTFDGEKIKTEISNYTDGGKTDGSVDLSSIDPETIGFEQISKLENAAILRQEIANLFPGVVNKPGAGADSALDEEAGITKDVVESIKNLDSYIDSIVSQMEKQAEKLEDSLDKLDGINANIVEMRNYKDLVNKKYGDMPEAAEMIAEIDSRISALISKYQNAYNSEVSASANPLGRRVNEASEVINRNPGFSRPRSESRSAMPSMVWGTLPARIINNEMRLSAMQGISSKSKRSSDLLQEVADGTSLSSGSSKASEFYANLTSKMMEMIEKAQKEGTQWEFPWHRTEMFPRNDISKIRYQGGNIIQLLTAQEEKGYKTPVWATFNQWKSAGGMVRKGEKSTKILRPVFSKGGIDEETGESKAGRLVGYAVDSVFNLDQIDGVDRAKYERNPMDTLSPEQRVKNLEDAINEVGAVIETGNGTQAYFSPLEDKIVLPPFELFKSPEGYYATAAHELVHWTGHSSRLDRPGMKDHGNEAYAREELVAELGSSFLMAMFGLSPEPREDHAMYLASWLKRLREEPNALQEAAAAAQSASKFLLERMPSLAKALKDLDKDEETVESKGLEIHVDPKVKEELLSMIASDEVIRHFARKHLPAIGRTRNLGSAEIARLMEIKRIISSKEIK